MRNHIRRTRKMTFLFFFFVTFYSFGQVYEEMKLNPKGNIVYRGEEIKKLKNIKGIILEKNDEELYQIYRKTVRGNNVAMVFARIRDFGLTYAVFNEPFTFNIQPVPLVLGLGGLATNLSLRKKTQRNLEELVETHNQIYIKEQYGK